MSIKIIAAVSQNGCMGDANSNDIPWKGRYPQDFKFFRKMTTGGQVIFGRKTFESLNMPQGLPKRRNVVITRTELDNVDCFTSLRNFFEQEKLKLYDTVQTYWLCGGAGIYREGMLECASEIYLTLIPEVIEGDNLVFFPWIDPTKFTVSETITLEDCDLKVVKYVKI